MARMIDAIELQKRMCALCNQDYADEPCEPSDCIFIRALNETPTLTQPNEWVSVEERLPEPGERVLATDFGFVGEFYINKRGKWQRYNVNCSELLMALDILYWMPLPAPPAKEDQK